MFLRIAWVSIHRAIFCGVYTRIPVRYETGFSRNGSCFPFKPCCVSCAQICGTKVSSMRPYLCTEAVPKRITPNAAFSRSKVGFGKKPELPLRKWKTPIERSSCMIVAKDCINQSAMFSTYVVGNGYRSTEPFFTLLLGQQSNVPVHGDHLVPIENIDLRIYELGLPRSGFIVCRPPLKSIWRVGP